MGLALKGLKSLKTILYSSTFMERLLHTRINFGTQFTLLVACFIQFSARGDKSTIEIKHEFSTNYEKPYSAPHNGLEWCDKNGNDDEDNNMVLRKLLRILSLHAYKRAFLIWFALIKFNDCYVITCDNARYRTILH